MLDPEDAAQLEEFLAPSRIAVVGTISPSGMPQLTPNWYVYQDGRLSFSTTKERVKYRNLSQQRPYIGLRLLRGPCRDVRDDSGPCGDHATTTRSGR